MVVKVYVSGISGNKEVKKRQQRVLMILDSKSVKYDVIDIAEPGKDSEKEFMQINSKSNGGTVSDPNPRHPLPPQVFNDEEYCGDYDQFDLANEVDTLEQFLKVEGPKSEEINDAQQNGDTATEDKNGVPVKSEEATVETNEEQENADEIVTTTSENKTTDEEPVKNEDSLKKLDKDDDQKENDDTEENKTEENKTEENGDIKEEVERVSASRESSKEKELKTNGSEDDAPAKEIAEELESRETETKDLSPSEELIESEKHSTD